MLNNKTLLQSNKIYLSCPIRQFKLGDNYSIMGYQRPISMFQQFA
jgi:hypothetical protein